MFCGLAEIWRRLSTVRQSAMQNDAKLLRKATERTKLNELKNAWKSSWKSSWNSRPGQPHRWANGHRETGIALFLYNFHEPFVLGRSISEIWSKTVTHVIKKKCVSSECRDTTPRTKFKAKSCLEIWIFDFNASQKTSESSFTGSTSPPRWASLSCSGPKLWRFRNLVWVVPGSRIPVSETNKCCWGQVCLIPSPN